MFDNKMLKAQSAQETLFPAEMCVRASKQANYTLSLGAPIVDKIHTKYVKMAGLESIHLKQFMS